MKSILDHSVGIEQPTAGEANLGYHWMTIGTNTAPGGYQTVLVWRMLPYTVLTKWLWYFHYRAALLKIQNPRIWVNMRSGFEDNIDPNITALIRATNLLRAKKAKVTELQNKLRAFQLNWTSLFPIEDDTQWQKAIRALNEKRQQLSTMEATYQHLKSLVHPK